MAAPPVLEFVTWESVLNAPEKILLIVALIVTGGWAYFRYLKRNASRVRLDPTVSGMIFRRDGNPYVIVTLGLKNIGHSRVPVEQRGTALLVRTCPAPSQAFRDLPWGDPLVFEVFLNHTWLDAGDSLQDKVSFRIPPDQMAVKLTLRLVSMKTQWTAEDIIFDEFDPAKATTDYLKDQPLTTATILSFLQFLRQPIAPPPGRAGTAETDSKSGSRTAIIAASATLGAAMIAGIFGLVQARINFHSGDKAQPPPTIQVQPNIPITVNNNISTETPSQKPEQTAPAASPPSKPVQQTPSQPGKGSSAPDDIDVEMITTLITNYISAINTLYTTGDAGAIMPLLKGSYDQSNDQVFVTKLMLEQSFKGSSPRPTSIRLISCKIVSFTADKAMVEVQSTKTFRAADAQSAPTSPNTLKIIVQKIDDHWLILQG